MKNFFYSILIGVFVTCVPVAATVSEKLVPLPVSVEEISAAPLILKKNATYKMKHHFQAKTGDAVKYFSETMQKRYGNNLSLPVVFSPLENPATVGGNAEGYVLEIGNGKIKLSALSHAGYFYAIQTLLQMLPPSDGGDTEITLPACKIIDYPRFPWRGFMLDSVRHYQSPEWIKKLIDLLASQKINTLHWHLTDDQGWRIEIKKYPELTRKAAWRKHIGFGLNPDQSSHYDQSGNYGGFYSQEEIREIIRYAASRNITVVPEIELPGHAVAALSVYPEFGCTGGPYEIRLIGGVSDDVYCAGNEIVYSFWENVFEEVVQLFPGTFVHVGGDECPKIRWKTCPKCQAKIRSENLKNEHELQSYVIRRVQKILEKHGKRLIGWDEILEGGLAPGAAVMSWRGASGGIAAAKMRHDVVMSPNSHCYYDYSQAHSGEPRSFGGFIPLDRAYEFNPTEGVPAEFHKYILGGQANLWTEYIPNEKHAEYMIAPRISALAEATWTPQNRRSWEDFQTRMTEQYKRFECNGINYRRPESIQFLFSDDKVSFFPDLKNARIAYTFDGSEPSSASPTVATSESVPVPQCGNLLCVRACTVFPDGSLGRINERLLNLPKATVFSTLKTEGDHVPARVFDGARASVFWASGGVRLGDTVTLVFDEAQMPAILRCVTGKNETGGGGDRLYYGVLEISSDEKNWRKIAEFKDGFAESRIPAGIPIKAVRLRATAPQDEWLLVREFEIR